MPGKHRVKKNHHANVAPYYDANCSTCGRPLTMRKGRKAKCPICDGRKDPRDFPQKKIKLKTTA